MKETDEEIKKVESEFLKLLKELTSTDDNTQASINDFINMFEGE